MTAFASWWIASTALGLAAFPIAWRLFSRLPDRGFGLSRALGILAAGYLVWIGSTFGVMRNDLSGVLGALVILICVAVLLGRGRWREMSHWAAARWRSLLAMEAVFLASFALWAFVRANNPEISATEKPMELAFLNALMRSKSMPPPDPWLSGYPISYYYFGYVLLSMLTHLTGVTSAVAFNLGNALWFGLTALGAYSLIFNLLSRRSDRPRIGAALTGPLFVLLTGNLEGFLEVLHARHLLWSSQATGEWVSGFWNWLGIKDLMDAPRAALAWLPNRHLWWWRASRVVHDINLAGVDVEVIDEFPFFSFLLADNHPHLLALPFVLLAVALAMQVFFAGKRKSFRIGPATMPKVSIRWILLGAAVSAVAVAVGGTIPLWKTGIPALEIALAAIKTAALGLTIFAVLATLALFLLGHIPSALSAPEFWFSAWIFGSLAFLNTWDFPIYFLLLLMVMWWTQRQLPALTQAGRLLATSVGLALVAILLYLPWYPTFSSQARGIGLNLTYPTHVPQLFIMFGTALMPLLGWLGWRIWRGRRSREGWMLIGLGVGLPLALFLASILGAGLAYLVIRNSPAMLASAVGGLGAGDLPSLVSLALERRLLGSWTALLLGLMLACCVLLLWRWHAGKGEPKPKQQGNEAWPFVVMLIAVGALLVLFPEFFHLRDLFETRMNTVFKFYFAAWVLWGLAGAYAAVELWPRRWGLVVGLGVLLAIGPQIMQFLQDAQSSEGIAGNPWIILTLGLYLMGWLFWLVASIYTAVRLGRQARNWLGVLRGALILPVFLGLVYTVSATMTKTGGFVPASKRTLDGNAYLAPGWSEEMAAIEWINENLNGGVIAEAIGGSYSGYARISTHTGLPTVLGWEFHEMQWRGGAETQGSRSADIRLLYESRSWEDAKVVIDRYNIAYVYVGWLEESTYSPVQLQKFETNMEIIYQTSEVTIFAMPEGSQQ